VLALVFVIVLRPHVGLVAALVMAVVAHLVLVPQLFQYSRVIWAHINAGTGAIASTSTED